MIYYNYLFFQLFHYYTIDQLIKKKKIVFNIKMIKKSTNKVLVLSLLFLVILSCSINNDYPWTSIALDEIINDNTDKLVLVDFETEWCVWCDRLDTDTYTDQRVIEFAKKNLISKKIDAEKNNGPQQKKKYRVEGYPTILLLDSEGNEIDRIIGYRPPEEFFNELNRIKNRENTLSDLITRYKQSINNSSVKIDLAEKYILMNLPDSARLLLDNIYSFQKKKHQLDFSVSFNLSQLYYKIRSLDRSIEILDQIVESGVDSSDIAYFFRLLYKSKRSSDIDALLEYAELSENIDRKQKSYWQIIRILKKHKRDPSLEAELYLKVIDLYTGDYKYLPSLLNGFAWRMTELEKNLDIALVKINKALEYGEDIKILDTKAEVLWKLNRSEEAVEFIEKCILSDPQNKYYKDQKKKFLSAST